MFSSPPAPLHAERMAQWVAEYGDSVRGFVYSRVRRHDVADDIVQEVFRKAWEARERYEEAGNGRGWLIRIADHLICDRARRSGREMTLDETAWQNVEPSDGASEPDSGLIAKESKAALEVALDGLSEAQRRVLLLRYYGSLGFAEIADQLKIPLNSVLSHCRRGLLALRKRLVTDANGPMPHE